MTGPAQHPETDASRREHLRVRNAAFWRTVALAVVVIVASHVIERRMSYSLADKPMIVHGGYGLSLARIPPKRPGTFRVLMLGNSVYQKCGICQQYRADAEAEHRPIEFINLAQIGASINDYPLELGWALAQDARPDAVIVSLGSFTFSDLGFTFNTDADQIAYVPSVHRLIPESFYERNFDRTAAVQRTISAIAPLRRIDTILQYDATQAIQMDLKERGVDIAWLTGTLPLPRLNLVVNQFDADRRRGRRPEGEAWLARPFKPDADQTFNELLDMIDHAGVPAFVIRQQCGHKPISEQALALIEEAVSRPRAVPVGFVDLEHLWTPDDFGDDIHPTREHAPAYTRSHYDAFIRFIESTASAAAIAPTTSGAMTSQRN
ncbi:MAG: hypothetical protein H6810_04285 [Phycisphaeraceae bacterium]|nr:MAG: hypothetical protein H6810_04285 [Phycisphaeraceae bacterium]